MKGLGANLANLAGMGYQYMETQIESVDTAEQQQRSYKRLWCSMMSAAIPGSGDWFIGNKKQCLVFLSLFFVLLFCFWPLRLPRFYWAILLLPMAGLALNIVSSLCTLLVKRDAKDAAANWWVLILLVVSTLFGTAELRFELYASGFRVFQVPGASMEPTIDLGDRIVVDWRYFNNRKPTSGEVVAFRHHNLVLVKRIVAVGGSTISSKDGQVEVDGRQIAEPYAVHRRPESSFDLNNFESTKVPPGQIFVMGDDRDESLDSRIRSGESDYGPVFVTDVVGKPLYRFGSKLRPSGYDGQKIR